MSFSKKLINISFILGQGAFGTSGENTVALKGYRVVAHITKNGQGFMPELQLAVYGITLSLMNQLTVMQIQIDQYLRNTVIVEVGDEETGTSTVFYGTVTSAWADLTDPPNGVFYCVANGGAINQLTPTDPHSYPNPVPADTVFSNLAGIMKMPFQNFGVTTTLPPSYFYGSPRVQCLQALAAAGNIEWNNLDNNRLEIWPVGGFRQGAIVNITPETNLIGFPIYTQIGFMCRALYSPDITPGAKIHVESSLFDKPKEFYIYGLEYILESKNPGGSWFVNIAASKIQLVVQS